MSENGGELITVLYSGADWAPIVAGKISSAAKNEIPFGAREAHFCGVEVKLRWHLNDITMMWVPDKISANQIVVLWQPRDDTLFS